MLTPDQDYTQELSCVYKEETYSVRDNGAVLRHSREGKRKRKDDDIWTFGIQNPKNGYMYIGQARIHQIVATAFHGEPADKNLVVDHRDSNKCNNRPENLHWVTRLDIFEKNRCLPHPFSRRSSRKVSMSSMDLKNSLRFSSAFLMCLPRVQKIK